ncbi:MAG: PfkB family carbohydrate kinase [Lentisphaeraceae bacterium]|nr:PfkB family carbohydrate kinase [Lentisphaeraceae bacterium]
MKIDVLCCGMLVADFSFSLARRPEPDEKVRSDSFFLTSGGPAANAALTVRLLGGSSELVATTGTDILGKGLIDSLVEDGFSKDTIIPNEKGLNAAAILTISDGSRNVISQKASFEPTVLPDAVDQLEPSVLLFDGHLPELSLQLMKKFPQARTVLDAGSFHSGTKALFDKVDWLIGSKNFAMSFSENESVREAIRELNSISKNVIITDGGSGLLYIEKNLVRHLAAYKVETVDSNGAGDVFHGAFSYGLAKGFSFMDNLKFASATAALSCTGRGIRKNVPSEKAVKEFLNR